MNGLLQCAVCRELDRPYAFVRRKYRGDVIRVCGKCISTARKERETSARNRLQAIADEQKRQVDIESQVLAEHYAEVYERQRKYYSERARSIRRATPHWVDRKELNRIYLVARSLTKSCAERFEVDHIIPIKGKTVCGLHVPWNLRIVPAFVNMKKGNRLVDPNISMRYDVYNLARGRCGLKPLFC